VARRLLGHPRLTIRSQVSMAHVGERLELERAFSGATVHDMCPGQRAKQDSE